MVTMLSIAYSLILSLSVYSSYVDLFLLFKLHLFLIHSLEQNNNYLSERNQALSIVSFWIEVSL